MGGTKGLALFVMFLLLAPTSAAAHGELEGTDPEAGSRVSKVPDQITITLTEAPAPGSFARATDGCRRRVPGSVSTAGNDLVLAVEGGEPGRWAVKYRAISAEDGHLTKEALAFSVAGKKDCSKDEPEETEIDGGSDTRVSSPDGGEETAFPLVPFVLASVAVAGVALVLRRRTSTGE